MVLYPHSRDKLKEIIKEEYPDSSPEKDIDDVPSYCLWMLDELSEFDDSKKAARWLGWILGRLESIGLLDNEESRRIVRKDVEKGLD